MDNDRAVWRVPDSSECLSNVERAGKNEVESKEKR
jgi:hypothetical protein